MSQVSSIYAPGSIYLLRLKFKKIALYIPFRAIQNRENKNAATFCGTASALQLKWNCSFKPSCFLQLSLHSESEKCCYRRTSKKLFAIVTGDLIGKFTFLRKFLGSLPFSSNISYWIFRNQATEGDQFARVKTVRIHSLASSQTQFFVPVRSRQQSAFPPPSLMQTELRFHCSSARHQLNLSLL